MLNDLPITLGVITLPSSCCAINVTTHTQIKVEGPSIIPSIAAGAKDNHGPKNGIKLATPANNTNTVSYTHLTLPTILRV